MLHGLHKIHFGECSDHETNSAGRTCQMESAGVYIVYYPSTPDFFSLQGKSTKIGYC